MAVSRTAAPSWPMRPTATMRRTVSCR